MRGLLGSPELLDALIRALVADGYVVIGPTERDGAIVLEEISGADDLPRGRGDEQAPGRYRLTDREDDAHLGFVVGPSSWREQLVPPTTVLIRSRRTADGFEIDDPAPPPPPMAFFGARACDLSAIEVLDRVLGRGEHADHDFCERRSSTFVVAVQCTRSAATCFCGSMGTGPGVADGADLVVTELVGPDRHVVAVESRTDRGDDLLSRLPGRALTDGDRASIDGAVAEAEGEQQRAVDPLAPIGRLVGQAEHPRWSEVATRCLACGNCTMVCPTCFCSTVEDTTDLSGDVAERVRRWDSCFTNDHSLLGGGPVRPDVRSQYRQWLTHKFDTWAEQFGTSGCVGCGRCITWCPVGIDVTEELAALLAAGRGGST